MKTNNEMTPNNNPTEVTFMCEWKSKFILRPFTNFSYWQIYNNLIPFLFLFKSRTR